MRWNSVGGGAWWNSVVEQWNSDGETMWWKSGTVLVEHSVKQRWWKSVVEEWNSDGGTVIVEQSGRNVKQCWLNDETEMVEQCGGKVEQWGWNSVVEQWNSDGETV